MSIQKLSIRLGYFTVSDYYIEVVLIAVLVFLNSIAANIPMLALLLGLCETFYLIYRLFCNHIEQFTITALVLLSTNIENQQFALGSRNTAFFSLYHLPVVRGYLLLLIMAVALVKCYQASGFRFSSFRFLFFHKKNGFDFFYRLNFTLAVMAFPMTAIVLFTNDNGMLNHTDMWRYIARDGYEMLQLIAIMTLVCCSLRKDDVFVTKLKHITLSILSGTTWASLLLILCGNYYNVWGSEYYITCPLILFFAPGLILFLFEEHGFFHLLTGMIAILVQLRFTVGIAGTWWIFLILAGIVFLKKMLTLRGTVVKKVPMKLICLAGIIIVGIYIISSGQLHVVTGQVSYKLSTILAFFQKGGSISDKFGVLGDSVKTRVEEIVNAIIEIVLKPFYLLFGKGYGGTVTRHWGDSNWNISGSTFADCMIQYQTYSAFHISLAEIIINFGLVGVVLILFMAKEFLAEFFRKDGNMWIVLGVLWFVFFYSLYYSFNLGMAWICCGLYIKYGNRSIAK